MMSLALIRARAQVASFRVPEAQTFQKTLPLPPYTTLVGILGAALGYSFEQACRWVHEHHIRMGVRGTSQGTFKDLWKIQKIKKKSVESDVILREYLEGVELLIAFEAPTREGAESILQAFFDPTYALTVGNSDSLLLIDRKRSYVEDYTITLSSEVEETVLPFDVKGQYKPHRSILELPITQTLQSPLVYRLPVEFSFDTQQRRTIKAREAFSFVGHPIVLDTPVEGYKTSHGFFVMR